MNSHQAVRNEKFNLNDLDDAIDQCLRLNKKSIDKEKLQRIHRDKEKLQRIHRDCNVYYNSVNVLCGRQGSGKTFTSMKECIKVSMLSPETHLLIVICKDETSTDPTVETLKPLLQIPIVYITEDNAIDYVKTLLEYKRFYDLIKREHLENKIEDDQVDEVFNVLHINDWSRKWLHTLLIFNDIAKSKLLKKADGYFNQLFPICRHIQCSFFLNVQFWKSIPTEIKANITTAFIFGGFSRQQFLYIIHQLTVSVGSDDLFNVYQQLTKNEKLIINCDAPWAAGADGAEGGEIKVE